MRGIRFVERDMENKVMERATLTANEYGKALIRQEKKARHLMEEEDADHVVYGLRVYNRFDQPVVLQLFLMPMDEDRFEAFSKSCRSAIVYALHRR